MGVLAKTVWAQIAAARAAVVGSAGRLPGQTGSALESILSGVEASADALPAEILSLKRGDLEESAEGAAMALPPAPAAPSPVPLLEAQAPLRAAEPLLQAPSRALPPSTPQPSPDMRELAARCPGRFLFKETVTTVMNEDGLPEVRSSVLTSVDGDCSHYGFSETELVGRDRMTAAPELARDGGAGVGAGHRGRAPGQTETMAVGQRQTDAPALGDALEEDPDYVSRAGETCARARRARDMGVNDLTRARPRFTLRTGCGGGWRADPDDDEDHLA